MTEKYVPSRAAWLAAARPVQIPPEKYDLLTFWADRGWGKTRAALEAALEWSRHPVDSRRGPVPTRTAVFVESVTEGMSQLVYGAGGIVNLSDMRLEVDTLRSTVRFENGAEWRFYRYSDPEAVRSSFAHHAILEDSDQARADELDAIMKALNQELKWAPDPHIIMTCHYLPSWTVHRLAGGRNHLVVGGNGAENAGLPEAYVQQLERSR